MTILRILLVLITIPYSIFAQSVEVKKETSRLEGQNVEGYQVVLNAPEQEVKTSLSRYLKAIGKTKPSGDYITIADAVIGGTKYPGTMYASIKQVSNSAAVWIGMNNAGKEPILERQLEKMAYDFGVAFQREQIQVQIDESLRALQAVEKQQLRLLNQGKDLNGKLESNKIEKVQLEKSLVENRAELEDLVKKIEANKKAQDSVAIATQQIRKVVDMHKNKQQSVH